MTRISKRQLETLDRKLSDRDKAILRSLQSCKYLTTIQIKRLHFTDNATPKAAHLAANRGLSKLQDYGLISALNRRIGGAQYGSSSYIWLLSEVGDRLLNLNRTEHAPRKRFFEPSSAFLLHTLAVSEIYLQTIEICERHDLKLVKTELEPNCWRNYTGEDGKPTTLRPDMFAVTSNEEYENNWFIEMDLDTESPCVVLEKCQRYVYYYKTGTEQKKTGVFPLVVWVVPSVARKESLQRNIARSRELKIKNAFLVITPDELEGLIQKGGP